MARRNETKREPIHVIELDDTEVKWLLVLAKKYQFEQPDEARGLLSAWQMTKLIDVLEECVNYGKQIKREHTR